jgi:hypothetical protein
VKRFADDRFCDDLYFVLVPAEGAQLEVAKEICAEIFREIAIDYVSKAIKDFTTIHALASQ